MDEITVEQKADGTQIWTHATDGAFTFYPVSMLFVGLEMEDPEGGPSRLLTQAEIDDLSTAGPPAETYVKVRRATAADLAKPTAEG